MPAFLWYAVAGEDLAARLADTAPYLAPVDIFGSRRDDNGSGTPAAIEPPDDGEPDVFALLGAVRAVGVGGPIGLQGDSASGDARTRPGRSLTAYRDIERRVDAPRAGRRCDRRADPGRADRRPMPTTGGTGARAPLPGQGAPDGPRCSAYAIVRSAIIRPSPRKVRPC